MTKARIMYVCSDCAGHNPEGCGHYNPLEIAVLPNGNWICQDCFEDSDLEGDWNDLPSAPEYVAAQVDAPAILPQRALEAAAERVCWFDWSSNDTDAVAAVEGLRTALTHTRPHQPEKQS